MCDLSKRAYGHIHFFRHLVSKTVDSKTMGYGSDSGVRAILCSCGKAPMGINKVQSRSFPKPAAATSKAVL